MSRIPDARQRITIWDGYRFALGVMLLLLAGQIVSYAFDQIIPLPHDDSDSPSARSGLRIKTDHLTGCQYFTTFTGGITPRLRSDGKQVCRP